MMEMRQMRLGILYNLSEERALEVGNGSRLPNFGMEMAA